jgi:hypothetical protein
MKASTVTLYFAGVLTAFIINPPQTILWRGSVYTPTGIGYLYSDLATARGREANRDTDRLISDRRLIKLGADFTPEPDVLILDRSGDLVRVRVLTGPEKGTEGWMEAKGLK